MKKVVIFGGSGFLGSYIADELVRRNYQVTIADLTKSTYLRDNQSFKKVNILDINSVLDVIDNANIVYNFVAVANIEEAISEPLKTMNINVMGNLNILEACKKKGNIERYIYASSVYALSEEGSFYGISKYTSEKLTEEYFNKYGLNYTVIRYGSLYGERASHNNYIYTLLKEAIISGKLEYKGNGEDLREYIHASDAAKLSVDIIENQQYENEHIILTGIERFKRIELLTMINEIMNNKLVISQVDDYNIGHYTLTPYSFRPTNAKKLVSNPYIDLGQGLLECIHEINKELENK